VIVGMGVGMGVAMIVFVARALGLHTLNYSPFR